MVLYRGKEYPVTARDGNKLAFDGRAFYIPPGLSEDEIRDACAQLYRVLAKRHITARAAELAGKMSLTPAAVKITSAKTRWGSCSSRNNINFSWRLILASDPEIDYVIVHELAHLVEMNHSARFWRIVESVIPDRKKQESRLRVLERRLFDEGWG
ncbi:MAG: M48 family metallopeptidase [Clostridiales bacterium]|nr:M48 family metallopeptidase [Clostridiales bacterium]